MSTLILYIGIYRSVWARRMIHIVVLTYLDKGGWLPGGLFGEV